MSCAFSIEITLNLTGVLSVKVLGSGWEQSADAHALLQRLSPLIQQLDAEAKLDRCSGLEQSSHGIQ
jgi:hypothetical protein